MSRHFCPGYTPPTTVLDSDDSFRITATGTASEYHLHPDMPHLFCGCGNEAESCHPGRCCRDDEYGQCRNCGMPAPKGVTTVPEETLSDTLFGEVPA